MPIQPYGTQILNVPNVYVQIKAPTQVLSGVSTSFIGVVGGATYGPVSSPITIGSMQEFIQNFGLPQASKHDLGTAVYVASLQSANTFVCVRETDGTDTSSTGNLLDNTSPNQIPGAILTSLYTGTTANTLNAIFSQGSSYTPSVPTYKLTIYLTGSFPEVYDNIGGTGNVFWQNVVTAVNMGNSFSGPSKLVTASLATGTGSAVIYNQGTGYTVGDVLTFLDGTYNTPTSLTVTEVDVSGGITDYVISESGDYIIYPPIAPTALSPNGGTGTNATFGLTQGAQNPPLLNTVETLTGGTNGGPISTEILVGTDGLTRTGMYALRDTNSSIVMLADADDHTFWTQQVAFSQSGSYPYVIGTIAPGFQENIAGAVTLKQTSGISSSGFRLSMGDWCQINDPYNNIVRFVSPQSFICGILSTIRADGSALNKPMNGIIATQKSLSGRTYSDADLSILQSAGIDVITFGLPVSASAVGSRLGVNTSSNNQTNQDNYPRMINFLGNTILRGMGAYVGLPQTPGTRISAKNTIQSFLSVLANETLPGGPMIGDVNNPGVAGAFKVILDETNNPPDRVSLGFMQCDVQVVLFSIILYMVVTLDAAQNISIQISTQ